MKILKKISKTICIVLGILALGLFLFYMAQVNRIFGKTSSSTINPQTQSFEEILELSDELTMEKKLFSFRKHYYILSDGVLIGEVTGKLFPIFGDVLKLKDIHGNLIKKESQIKRLGLTQVKGFNASINRLAKVEDSNNNLTGYIGEEKLKDFFKLKHIQYFYDKEYKKKGSGKPDAILFCKDYKIYDTKKNIDYIIDGNFFSPTSKYKIEIIDDSDVPVEDAIFYTIIENSIVNSKTKKSTSSSSKSKK